jgi:hypothetical protein
VSAWFNYTALLQIVFAGLLVGAGLPALFAVAVRINADGAGVAEHGGAVAQKNPILAALGWTIFALVLLVVIAGVLFIARDFIGHHTGLYLFGAKHK